MYNMLTIGPCTLLQIDLHLKHVMDTFLSHQWTFFLLIKEDGYDNADKVMKFIQKIQKVHEAVQEHLEKIQAKYKIRHGKHQMDHHFKVGDLVWLYINKERLKGEGKKLKSIRYGLFKIV